MRYFLMIITALLMIGCSNQIDWFEIDDREQHCTEDMVVYTRILLGTQWCAFEHKGKIVEFGLRPDGVVVWRYKDNKSLETD